MRSRATSNAGGGVTGGSSNGDMFDDDVPDTSSTTTVALVVGGLMSAMLLSIMAFAGLMSAPAATAGFAALPTLYKVLVVWAVIMPSATYLATALMRIKFLILWATMATVAHTHYYIARLLSLVRVLEIVSTPHELDDLELSTSTWLGVSISAYIVYTTSFAMVHDFMIVPAIKACFGAPWASEPMIKFFTLWATVAAVTCASYHIVRFISSLRVHATSEPAPEPVAKINDWPVEVESEGPKPSDRKEVRASFNVCLTASEVDLADLRRDVTGDCDLKLCKERLSALKAKAAALDPLGIKSFTRRLAGLRTCIENLEQAILEAVELNEAAAASTQWSWDDVFGVLLVKGAAFVAFVAFAYALVTFLHASNVWASDRLANFEVSRDGGRLARQNAVAAAHGWEPASFRDPSHDLASGYSYDNGSSLPVTLGLGLAGALVDPLLKPHAANRAPATGRALHALLVSSLPLNVAAGKGSRTAAAVAKDVAPLLASAASRAARTTRSASAPDATPEAPPPAPEAPPPMPTPNASAPPDARPPNAKPGDVAGGGLPPKNASRLQNICMIPGKNGAPDQWHYFSKGVSPQGVTYNDLYNADLDVESYIDGLVEQGAIPYRWEPPKDRKKGTGKCVKAEAGFGDLDATLMASYDGPERWPKKWGGELEDPTWNSWRRCDLTGGKTSFEPWDLFDPNEQLAPRAKLTLLASTVDGLHQYGGNAGWMTRSKDDYTGGDIDIYIEDLSMTHMIRAMTRLAKAAGLPPPKQKNVFPNIVESLVFEVEGEAFEFQLVDQERMRVDAVRQFYDVDCLMAKRNGTHIEFDFHPEVAYDSINVGTLPDVLQHAQERDYWLVATDAEIKKLDVRGKNRLYYRSKKKTAGGHTLVLKNSISRLSKPKADALRKEIEDAVCLEANVFSRLKLSEKVEYRVIETVAKKLIKSKSEIRIARWLDKDEVTDAVIVNATAAKKAILEGHVPNLALPGTRAKGLQFKTMRGISDKSGTTGRFSVEDLEAYRGVAMLFYDYNTEKFIFVEDVDAFLKRHVKPGSDKGLYLHPDRQGKGKEIWEKHRLTLDQLVPKLQKYMSSGKHRSTYADLISTTEGGELALFSQLVPLLDVRLTQVPQQTADALVDGPGFQDLRLQCKGAASKKKNRWLFDTKKSYNEGNLDAFMCSIWDPKHDRVVAFWMLSKHLLYKHGFYPGQNHGHDRATGAAEMVGTMRPIVMQSIEGISDNIFGLTPYSATAQRSNMTPQAHEATNALMCDAMDCYFSVTYNDADEPSVSEPDKLIKILRDAKEPLDTATAEVAASEAPTSTPQMWFDAGVNYPGYSYVPGTVGAKPTKPLTQGGRPHASNYKGVDFGYFKEWTISVDWRYGKPHKLGAVANLTYRFSPPAAYFFRDETGADYSDFPGSGAVFTTTPSVALNLATAYNNGGTEAAMAHLRDTKPEVAAKIEAHGAHAALPEVDDDDMGDFHRSGLRVGQYITGPNGASGLAVARVVGYLSVEAEEPYKDDSGTPQPLWRVAWLSGSGEIEDFQDFEEHELTARGARWFCPTDAPAPSKRRSRDAPASAPAPKRSKRAATKTTLYTDAKNPSTSQFMGVTRAPSGRWSAEVHHAHKKYYLGKFDTDVDAARAVDLKKIELGLDPVNFPASTYTPAPAPTPSRRRAPSPDAPAPAGKRTKPSAPARKRPQPSASSKPSSRSCKPAAKRRCQG